MRDDDGAAGRGFGKKRMPVSNRPDIGYALIRKDADFPLVSHGMNRDKPMNMRKSITPNGEMLIDAVALLDCKLEIQRQILPPDKGDGRLEPYDGKLSSTVLRRVGAGNRSFLFGRTGSAML